ncbi:MAG TPA: c-type cytochrome domain-containing protein, partial [Verrucomicrobiae bacterium]|nr:c-type cytochrome domain-containing protein [Verrucomicrobiae bacterium]
MLFVLLLAAPLLAEEPILKPIPITRPDRTDRVSFHREVLPVLQANCLPCHNQTRSKADLILETPETMLKGSESGTVLVPGKPAESALLQAAAHQLEDTAMPPADNKANARDLTPEELGTLSLWIEQGAEADAATENNLAWQAFPTNVVSSFAVSLTGDGQSVAVARANRVFLYDVKSGRPAGQLSDLALNGAAQRDWVNALAFSPDGDVLAAAGFREVRLWRRQPVFIQPAWSAAADTDLITAAFSHDRRLLASMTRDGRMEVRRVTDGGLIGSWPLLTAPVAPLAWTSDDHWLAAAGVNGTVLVVSPESSEKPLVQTVKGDVTDLAWFDQGRQLAVVVADANTIQTFQRMNAPTSEVAFETGAERIGHSAAITALATEPGAGGSLVSASADGFVRRWFPDATTVHQELHLDGSILGLDPVGPNARCMATLADGGATLVS